MNQAKTSAQRGYGSAWQKARAAFLRGNPLCAFCRREGRLTAASVVDHVIPHKGDMDLFWDSGNWQSLCKPHHDRDKKLIEAGKTPRGRIGIDGYPVRADDAADH